VQSSKDWLYEIKPKGKLFDLNLKEIWRYRDLLILFVKRDIVTAYKQTILGPLWYLVQPLFTSFIFTLIFNNLAGVETPGVPPFLFNLAGVTLWTYFKEILNSTSSTFKANASLFGKVYFPRFIVPGSKAISGLFKLGIQLLIFIGFYSYYRIIGLEISPSGIWFLFPIAILALMLIAMGVGMILSAMTTKYRDLSVLISFGLNLLMYISAVMYPLSEAKDKLTDFYWAVQYNPLAQIIESFRYMLLNTGTNDMGIFINTLIMGSVLFVIGLAVFNRTERNFIDTV